MSDSQFRKVRKLANDPERFLKDSFNKHTHTVRKYLPIKYNGHFQYTIVSAVYNVAKYLDEYFDSLINQSLDFKKHIHLILVDDGSTDDSAQIIKKWQKKYPKNIHYYYKENGGQASARNLGLQYVKTDWVTFIDPDDFVESNYFLRVDESLSDNHELSLVSCPFIFYLEDIKVFNDTHPLKYRFSTTDNIITLNDMGKNMQLSVNSAFFRTAHLLDNNITFHEEVKPNFEDAKFVGDYFASLNQNSQIAFIANTSYFYRKRSDGTSTLDGAWKKPTLYGDVLSKGCLLMLTNAKETLGYVPVYMQRTVLYHLSWYFKYIVNNESTLDVLTNEQKEHFVELVYQIFNHIDEQVIMEFELAGTWFFQKVAWLGCFKNQQPPFQIAYVDNIDKAKKQILVYYFSHLESNATFYLNNNEVIPAYQKTVMYDFVGQTYVYEHRYWVSYGDDDKTMIDIKIGEIETRISLAGKQHKAGLPVKVLLRDFASKKYNSNPDIWIIMDRDTQADDNGEHLYRYIAKHHPKQEIYFALNRDSVDWDRLSTEGFNLLEFGSPNFENKLKIAGKLISSHLDKYINDYFDDNFEFDKKFIFLQHGITMNDISSWVNSKRNLQLFIMSTQDEYKAITGQKSKYKTTKKEAVLAGFPRHDDLLKNNNQNSKTILIMPTWRKSILGANANGNAREINLDFMATEYAQAWQNFIKSPTLHKLMNQYGYQLIFAPHANIEPYLGMFDIPDYVQIWRKENGSIQTLFQNSALMITDYSSVHFEMGILNKTVLYYQFDKESFFKDGHVFGKGYFDYEQHGFGAVVETENDLLTALEQVLKNDGKPIEPYATRIQNTFPFRDGKNCERVYQAILDLDKPDDNAINIDILSDFIHQAKQHEDWSLLEQRLDKLFILAHDDETINIETHHKDYLLALSKQHKYLDMLSHLCRYQVKNTNDWLNIINEDIKQTNPDFMAFIINSQLDIDETLQNIIKVLQKHHQDKLEHLYVYLVNALVANKSWQLLNTLFANHKQLKKTLVYEYVLSQVRLGKFAGLDKVLPKPVYGHDYDYWQLAHDVALLNDDIELQRYCTKGMIAIFPEREKERNTHLLNTMN